jgi:2-methylisocitrate lyase-like PEP mutase family enzyme
MHPARKLRDLMEQPGLLEVPGVYDGLSARLVERAGFPAAYVTGFGAAASRLGVPDTGLVSFKEMADHVTALVDAVSIPLLADADTGYGNPLNVHRTTRAYARAGAAAIQIEDQAWPKRCGHTAGKEVLALPEAVGKVRAAVDARAERDIVVIARTDARAVLGFDAALERCQAFADAGADVVFLEAPESREELRRVARAIDVPLLVNLLEGGKTPLLPRAELEALGYKIAIRPLTLLFAAAHAVQEHLRDFRAWDGPLSFDELRELTGFPEYDRKLGAY